MHPTFDEIQQWHRDGRLVDARDAYLEYLGRHPDDVKTLHMLGILHAELGDLDAALAYLEKALALKKNDPVLGLHLANILKAKGLFSQAGEILLAILREHPGFAAAYNNLGTVYFAQEKWLEAAEAYQAAIRLQSDYVDAYYNLGLALARAGRRTEAMAAWRALLELAPAHPGAHFQLGRMLMEQQQYQAAIQHFSAIEREHPFHFETRTNLATCYLRLGGIDKAREFYLQALELMPLDVQVLFNLGVISMQEGRVEEAVKYYQRAVRIQPDLYEAHNNLGAAWLVMKNRDSALLHFREALRIQPHNEGVRHVIRILEGEKNLPAASPEYVQSLFDSYAGHYDSHLGQVLHYRVPESLYQIVKESRELPDAGLDILDLGCGTGLCGVLFRAAARRLTGVDISRNMLDEAGRKSVYDELVQADILSFMRSRTSQYDLILAGDVLVYHGDLALVFAAAAESLRPGGLFAYNAEISDKEDHFMTGSGRFAHSKYYLDNLAVQNGLSVMKYKVITMRTQDQKDVPGHLYLLRK